MLCGGGSNWLRWPPPPRRRRRPPPPLPGENIGALVVDRGVTEFAALRTKALLFALDLLPAPEAAEEEEAQTLPPPWPGLPRSKQPLLTLHESCPLPPCKKPDPTEASKVHVVVASSGLVLPVGGGAAVVLGSDLAFSNETGRQTGAGSSSFPSSMEAAAAVAAAVSRRPEEVRRR